MRIGSKKNTLLWSAVALIFIAGGVFSQGSAGADSAGSSYTEKIVFPLLTLNLCESHNRKYKVKIVKNTATVEPEPHEDFGGVVLCFDRERIGSLDAWANYDFGVAQYLFDDKPASPIGYVRPTGLVALNVDNGSIELPQSYDNIEGVEAIYPRIGFADKDEYDADFERRNFEVVKTKSLLAQRKFYEFQLKSNKKQLQECCPEYIGQAETFLNKKAEDFRSFAELAVEIYRAKTVIRIEGVSKEGETFAYKIIDK